MAKSATTRLIQELEDEMGVRLLIRTTRKLALTSVGQTVYDRAVELIKSYEDLSFICKENVAEPSGGIRVEVSALIGLQRLGSLFSSFLDENPKIELKLHIAEKSDGILSDMADVAIAVGQCIPQSLVARPLASLQMGLFASKGYLHQRGIPEHPSELVAEDFMVLSDPTMGQCHELVEETTGAIFSVARHAPFTANHADALIGAAIHGAGIALVPRVAAEAAQRQGLLIPLLGGWRPKALDVYLVYRSPRFEAIRVRKLIDHLLHTMSQHNSTPNYTTSYPPDRSTIRSHARKHALMVA
jgi:DNA-binding transcriptional LysR family regulator